MLMVVSLLYHLEAAKPAAEADDKPSLTDFHSDQGQDSVRHLSASNCHQEDAKLAAEAAHKLEPGCSWTSF